MWLAVTVVVCACVVWAVSSTWGSIIVVADDVARALWTLPVLIALHLLQLLLSALSWRTICATGTAPGLATFFRLRLIRESIDSLLPVAQIGGEVVGARLLVRRGMGAAVAGASVVVDLTMELVAQVLFLLIGLAVLGLLRGETRWLVWLEVAGGLGLMAAGFLAGQRLGVLRILEMFVEKLAERLPSFGGKSLAGLQAAALGFYCYPRRLLRSVLVHTLAWSLGSIETWLVLQAIGVPVTPLQAFVVESLGMAARSAGFAIPGALGAQEGGFMLAAASVGLPTEAALSLSVVKRIRELAVGVCGIWLWRTAGRPEAVARASS